MKLRLKTSIFFKRAPQTDDLKELIEQSKHPVIKKLEYDLNKYSLGEYAIIFNGKFSGLATFEWLNDQLSTPNDHFKFDWGSYGDDAIYKFYLLIAPGGTTERTLANRN